MKPLVSVVVPTKNEEVSVANFILWCKEGFEKANVQGEIILMDNSTDETPRIARELGARVIHVAEKGLGIAYLAAKNHLNGDIIILGDADCTYDFRNLTPFIEKINSGYDFVIGNRFKGSIEKSAMPFHHQYFGSPITSAIFKHTLGIPVGDIHCGMRAMTRSTFEKLPFLELGWEYASEMIVSARNIGARITEVPIQFLKEPEGRISHHRRITWMSPFLAGWGTLRVTATYALDHALLKLGLVLMLCSTVLNLLSLLFSHQFSNLLHFGLLSHSLLLLTTTIGALMYVTARLGRMAYRRTNNTYTRLTSRKYAKKMFNIFMTVSILEIVLVFTLAKQWLQGFQIKGTISLNLELELFMLSFSSLYIVILALTAVSLIGSQSERLSNPTNGLQIK